MYVCECVCVSVCVHVHVQVGNVGGWVVELVMSYIVKERGGTNQYGHTCTCT